MTETARIDAFLAASLRALRNGEAGVWTLDHVDDWKSVWSRIEFHGLPIILHSQAERLLQWPTSLLERVAEEARLVVLWETTHAHAVTAILADLTDAGVESVVMKGTALAYGFHDDPASRRRGDTDLLIAPADLDKTRAAFEAAGWYRKRDPHGLYYQEGWLHRSAGFFEHAVDLHWCPTDRPVLQKLLPAGGFFDRKVALPKLAGSAYRPDNATMVLHAVINQKWHAQHGYDAEDGRVVGQRRLIWSIDFDLLIRAFKPEDWEQLTTRALDCGAGPLVAEALLGAQEDLRTQLPQDRVQQLRDAPLSEDLTRYFSDADTLSQFMLDMRTSSGVGQKAKLLWTRAFPPRAHLLNKYPAASSWPTPILQGRLLIETVGRMLKKAGAR